MIQAHWRGFWARKQLRAVRQGLLLRSAGPRLLQDTAARVIQRRWRGVMGRAEARSVRKAIIDIQRCWKGYRARKVWPRLLRDFRWRTGGFQQ